MIYVYTDPDGDTIEAYANCGSGPPLVTLYIRDGETGDETGVLLPLGEVDRLVEAIRGAAAGAG